MNDKALKRWRLILGRYGDPVNAINLTTRELGMDEVLEALYDSHPEKGLGDSAPNTQRWLGDIRTYFPTPVVQMMQRDALDRLGLEEMLLEPELLETVQADVQLVSTLLSLKEVLPEKTRATAREVVDKVVQAIEARLKTPLQAAVSGALNKASYNRRPKPPEIDWNRTIRANLKHYQAEYGSIIPVHLYGHSRRVRQLKNIVLLLDQSASMANSVVYAAVAASILASIRTIKTQLVVFDTAVVNLSDQLHDPVSLLFGMQLGGGTYIGKAIKYARQLISNPSQTTVILISDLMEGGSEAELFRQVQRLTQSGVHLISLLALSDKGAPLFDKKVAHQFAELGIPAFACTPQHFPDLMAAALNRENIRNWAGREGIAIKN